MLLGLGQIRNYLLGVWILNKGNNTVEAVARGLYYKGPHYSSFYSKFFPFLTFFFFFFFAVVGLHCILLILVP